MHKINLIAASLLAALGAAAAGPALADTITQTFSVDHAGPDFVSNLPVVIGNFDPGLGTLTSETFALAGTFTPGSVWQTNPNEAPFPASVPVTLTGRVGVLTAKGALVLPSESLQAILAGGDYQATGTAENVSLTATAGPSNPAFDAAQVDIFAFDTTSPVPFPYGTGLADFWSLAGTLSVTYSYTPAAMPEPAALPVLLMGLLGLGACIRKRGGRGWCQAPEAITEIVAVPSWPGLSRPSTTLAGASKSWMLGLRRA